MLCFQMSPSEINGSIQYLRLSLPGFLLRVSLYPEAHPTVFYRNSLPSFSSLVALHCVPVPGLIDLALDRQTADSFPVVYRQSLNHRVSEVRWKKNSSVSCWRLQMIGSNFPITCNFAEEEKETKWPQTSSGSFEIRKTSLRPVSGSGKHGRWWVVCFWISPPITDGNYPAP